jgi:hypothetical protein
MNRNRFNSVATIGIVALFAIVCTSLDARAQIVAQQQIVVGGGVILQQQAVASGWGDVAAQQQAVVSGYGAVVAQQQAVVAAPTYYVVPTPAPEPAPQWSYLKVKCWGPCSRYFIDRSGTRWEQENYRKVPSQDGKLRGLYWTGMDGRIRFVAVWPDGQTRTFVDP